MNTKTKRTISAILALVLYAGLMVGLSLIFDLFWKMNKATTIIYWVITGIVVLSVIGFSVALLFGKHSKGISAIQLFFSVSLSFLPLLVRAICMIPVAGIYIGGILSFILIVMFFLTMIGLSNHE